MKGEGWMKRMLVLAVAAGLGLVVGCDDDSDEDGPSGPPVTYVGGNDINTVLCVGDSITDGECAPAGAPYPERLAGLSGKRTINEGVCGSTSITGRDRIRTLLDRNKPGYVCILYGVNDITFGRGQDYLMDNLQAMVQACKDNHSIPLLATLLPVYDSHRFAAGEIAEVNKKIRKLAYAMDAELVDLEVEFGINRSLIQPDGLHPSSTGNDVIALSFNDGIARRPAQAGLPPQS